MWRGLEVKVPGFPGLVHLVSGCWVYKFQTNFSGLQSQSRTCQQLWRDLTSVSLLCWQARSGDCIVALCLRRNSRQEDISTLVLSWVNGWWPGSRLEICSDAASNDCTDPTQKNTPHYDNTKSLISCGLWLSLSKKPSNNSGGVKNFLANA